MSARPDRRFTDRVVALHGFTQDHHHALPLALDVALVAPFGTVVAPDLPGHGLSTDDRADFEATAEGLPERCGPGTYIGYSMGGRVALAAAITRPDLVERLVLIGATAGIDDEAARAERRDLDERRAGRIEEIGVDVFVDEWLAAPMFARLPQDPRGLRRRRLNTPAGLAHSLRTAGTGSQPSLWSRLGEISAPTLVLAGERDEKFTGIGRRLVAGIPDANFASIPDAGHAAHTEQRTATTEAIIAWLRHR